MPEKDQTSNMPWSPSLGSQKLRAMSNGDLANEPGGYSRPRSRTHTSQPASARRYAMTEPPNPEPMTTTSKDWPSFGTNGTYAALNSGCIPQATAELQPVAVR